MTAAPAPSKAVHSHSCLIFKSSTVVRHPKTSCCTRNVRVSPAPHTRLPWSYTSRSHENKQVTSTTVPWRREGSCLAHSGKFRPPALRGSLPSSTQQVNWRVVMKGGVKSSCYLSQTLAQRITAQSSVQKQHGQTSLGYMCQL